MVDVRQGVVSVRRDVRLNPAPEGTRSRDGFLHSPSAPRNDGPEAEYTLVVVTVMSEYPRTWDIT